MLIWKHKIAFVHIPKCGGSSVENMFMDYLQLDQEWENHSHEELSRLRLGTSDSLQHSTQRELEDYLVGEGEDLQSWRFLAVVRNPIGRAISEFKYQKEYLKKDNPLYKKGDIISTLRNGDFWNNGFPYHEKSATSFLDGSQPIELLPLHSIGKELPFLLKEWTGRDFKVPHHNRSRDRSSVYFPEDKHSILWEVWGDDKWLVDFTSPHVVPKRKTSSNRREKVAQEKLSSLMDYLQTVGLHPFLMYGSALFTLRDGVLLRGHDTDIDIGVFKHDLTPEAKEKILGRHHVFWDGHHRDYWRCEIGIGAGKPIDIFTVSKDGDKDTCYVGKSTMHEWDAPIIGEASSTVQLEFGEFSLPSNPVRYLEKTYGLNWRDEVRKWNWETSHKCIKQ